MGNRDIKFRVFNGLKMELSVSLDYHNVEKTCKPVREGYQWFSEGNEIYNAKLMQYIGIKDKKGVDIYEGDIVTENLFWDVNKKDIVYFEIVFESNGFKLKEKEGRIIEIVL